MTLEQFQVDDLDRTITNEARIAVANLILAWAGFDSMMTYWVCLTLGVDLESGSIFLGNMDTRSKIDRMVKYHAHTGNTKGAAALSRLSKAHAEYVDCRNAVAHRRCLGMLRSDPTRMVFTAIKHIRGQPGQLEMMAIDLSLLEAATKFAENTAQQILRITEPMQVVRDAEEARRKDEIEKGIHPSQ